MKLFLRDENGGLKIAALFLAFLLWAYVHLIESGKVALLSSLTKP